MTTFGLTFFELLVPLMTTFIGALILYLVIRLGVRHGVQDAQRRLPRPGDGLPPM
jgi:hypothetical protein